MMCCVATQVRDEDYSQYSRNLGPRDSDECGRVALLRGMKRRVSGAKRPKFCPKLLNRRPETGLLSWPESGGGALSRLDRR
jgi:hypothetical protein